MTTRTHIFTEETGKRIADAVEEIAYGNIKPKFDATSGRYTNLGESLMSRRNGKIYGVKIPKYSSSTGTDCVKTGANAGLTVTPSTASSAGQDDYQAEFPFMGWDVNGGAEDDGSPFVTAMRIYDTWFKLDGTNGNVWRMAPVLYYRLTEYTAYWLLEICDSPLPGFKVQPGGLLPDGTVRPFMLYAKYAGGTYDGKLASVSGIPFRNRNISQNSLVDLKAALGDGYSGKSIADDWYIKVMFLMKYATKNSQSVFAGCTGYNLNYAVTVAEEDKTRVIIAKTNAANLIVGSAVSLGSSDHSNSVFGGGIITSIEDIDESNSAVNVKTSAAFTTTTSLKLSTEPWPSGTLDDVQGVDGTVTASGKTNGKEPFLLQGIECMLGAYEVLSGVMLYSNSDGVDVYVNHDTKYEAKAYDSAHYIDTGIDLTKGESAAWQYTKDIVDAGGLLVGIGTGASTSTGMCDGTYTDAPSTTGWREFLGLGALFSGASAGLWCVTADTGLAIAFWYIGSRLSATGRAAA